MKNSFSMTYYNDFFKFGEPDKNALTGHICPPSRSLPVSALDGNNINKKNNKIKMLEAYSSTTHCQKTSARICNYRCPFRLSIIKHIYFTRLLLLSGY